MNYKKQPMFLGQNADVCTVIVWKKNKNGFAASVLFFFLLALTEGLKLSPTLEIIFRFNIVCFIWLSNPLFI